MNWRVREKANRFRRYARERVLLALKGVPPEAFTLYMALFIVQGVNFLLLPLLSRKLGVQGFGFYSMLLSLALLGQTIIEYGSLFWGVREIGRAKNTGSRQDVARLFAAILLSKFILLVPVMAFSVSIIAITLPTQFQALASSTLLVWYISVALNVNWFYQGLGRMRSVFWLETFPRVILLMSVSMFVQRESDFTVPFYIQGVAGILVGMHFMRGILKEFGVEKPYLKEAIGVLKAGFPTFLYRAGVQFMVGINPLILGWISGPLQVGYYTSVEKLVRPWLSLIDPLNRAAYTRTTWLIAQNRKLDAWMLTKKVLLIGGMLGALIAAMLWLLGKPLIAIVLGREYMIAVPVLKTMALFLPIAFLSKIITALILLALGYDSVVHKVYLGAGLLNVPLVVLASYHNGALAVAACVVVIEATVLVAVSLFGLRVVRSKLLHKPS
ncbi:oligosaccharide flippase family protein [Thermus tengchongensis]|uniref:Flippase n=1 Tax=Thermus tengchongensis TaxID=1214928 RepID=A0A4Y9F731_9DEIN|nr:oligosaccharide flippase family protein [Thermus tengchongensis]TFU24845.1 hypothetical protein E0687_13275 [Thermus tengchongensis]